MASPPKPTWQEHAHHLALAFQKRLIEVPHMKPEEACALIGLDTVYCAPITERLTYAIALHELGHLIAPSGALRVAGVSGNLDNLRRDEEDAAWAWARQHALEWTADMDALAQWAEGTYRAAAAPAAPAAAPADPPKPFGQQIDWSEWE